MAPKEIPPPAPSGSPPPALDSLAARKEKLEEIEMALWGAAYVASLVQHAGLPAEKLGAQAEAHAEEFVKRFRARFPLEG